MKKRSMLAIASLATGFVVAAVTPSHAAEQGPVRDLKLSNTLGDVDHLVNQAALAVAENARGEK
ncbi:hypothetical protein [Streptomyces cellostaticus]|uniref:hypothetical protein n=1 Tax=Streptomyces TaxID=1883 RepID=UPI0020263680|nr:hypothetical protein [Streptomyces cellostaticus]